MTQFIPQTCIKLTQFKENMNIVFSVITEFIIFLCLGYAFIYYVLLNFMN